MKHWIRRAARFAIGPTSAQVVFAVLWTYIILVVAMMLAGWGV